VPYPESAIDVAGEPGAATGTRLTLIRAGEHLFARRGVDGVRRADLRRAAGRRDDAALDDHFGSLSGLLIAILRKHVEAAEPERRRALKQALRDPAPASPAALVGVLVTTNAASLHTEDGRDYLRILAQLAGSTGVQHGPVRLPVAGATLERVLDLLVAEVSAQVPEAVARERVAIVIGFMTSALADRARRIDGGDLRLPPHEAFTTDLTAMLAGALRP
jgi:AcrR family transcriptional regulator